MNAVAEFAGQLGGYRRLLGIRDYRLLWAAQVVSTYGDRLTQLALAALVYGITGSEVGLGLVLTVSRAAASRPRPVRRHRRRPGLAQDAARGHRLRPRGPRPRPRPVGGRAARRGLRADRAARDGDRLLQAGALRGAARHRAPRPPPAASTRSTRSTQGALDPIAFLVGGTIVAAVGARAAFGDRRAHLSRVGGADRRDHAASRPHVARRAHRVRSRSRVGHRRGRARPVPRPHPARQRAPHARRPR